MRKFFLVLLLIGLMSGVLIACGDTDAGEDVNTAVQYIEALNQRDIETANTLVCEERADEITDALMGVDDEEAEYSFENVACQAQEDDVSCRYTIIQPTDEEEEQFDRNVIFEFEDGVICGFEQGAAIE
jgi:hypothetical protein